MLLKPSQCYLKPKVNDPVPRACFQSTISLDISFNVPLNLVSAIDARGFSFAGPPVVQDMQQFRAQTLPVQGLPGVKEGQPVNFVQPIAQNIQTVTPGIINLQPIAGGQLLHPLAPCQLNQPIKTGQNLVAVQPVTMFTSTTVINKTILLKCETEMVSITVVLLFLRFPNRKPKKKSLECVQPPLIFTILNKNCRRFIQVAPDTSYCSHSLLLW